MNNIIIILIILIILIIIYIYKYNIELNHFDNNIQLNIHTVFILKENLPFLREWILYHLNLGFDKIYLYDNTGSIGVDGSNSKKNKYNINFDEIILLDDNSIQLELNKILNDYKDNIIYTKWQPRDKDNNIIYGQNESIVDYINNFKENNMNIIYTAFIDIDEFIFSPSNIILKDYIKKQYNNNVNKIIILQKKFIDRFCRNSKVIDIVDTIENINTQGWANKIIIRNDKLDINNIINMHNISITEGNTIEEDINVLRFNHYNVNIKQIEWMKGFYNMDKFDFGKDMTMSERYNNITNMINNYNNIINYDNVNNDLCKL